ncbi:hypothetical protein niasHS_015284 [Heterodera schachtii]|uniref:Uncharacterized protein n=1 Tax=Heterodera schachtii TaxID=97005 RepID=A0ABD2I2Y8_HETSC
MNFAANVFIAFLIVVLVQCVFGGGCFSSGSSSSSSSHGSYGRHQAALTIHTSARNEIFGKLNTTKKNDGGGTSKNTAGASSSRGTTNRGTTNRGTTSRGTTNRGTTNRGTTSRGKGNPRK